MKYVQVENGVVVLVSYQPMDGWTPAPEHVCAGYGFDGEAWTAPLPEPGLVDPKLVGVEFDGVMCSATGGDQNGLTAVLMTIQAQGAAFEPTRFSFENGSQLIITLQNCQALMDVWRPFRQSFFAVAPPA